MAVLFEAYLTEKQAFFIRRNLTQAIESMRALLRDLRRENARWHTTEADALMIRDEAEIAAIQHLVDALAAFQATQGWSELGVSEEDASQLGSATPAIGQGLSAP